RDWRVFEDKFSGFFAASLYQPFIALRAGGSDQTRLTIRHELAHHLSRFFIPRQPSWLAEGLASFFETLAYDRDRGEILIGLPSPQRLAVLRGGGASVVPTLN